MHGRERERALLTDLLSGARDGTAAAIVIRGEAGIGKSTLLDTIVDDATAVGMRILRSQGLESESPLAFAGLHQLLRPLLPHLDTLPAPQARALQVAFGQQEGPAVDPFLVALATLAMLTDAAETQAVLAVIDDAHWLDDASADALLFAARRLQADAVVLAFTARENDSRTFTADSITELRLEGLDDSASRALLAEQLGAPVTDDVARALLTQTGGNPLALVELPTELTHEQLAGAQPLPAQLHLTDRVQRVFLDRCRRLPQSVQTLLLIAATDDTGDLAAVQQAAAALGAETAALQQAVQARLLITDGDSLRVRHPLVRSAMYQAATRQERRDAHRALATALGDRHDPDRQAWHLAAATDGPDTDVADALERAAERADRAGGYTAAAAAHERAAALTAAEPLRATRLYAAARSAWAGGQASRAGALAEAARGIADERLLRADIDRLRARIEINVGPPPLPTTFWSPPPAQSSQTTRYGRWRCAWPRP
jgi:predicted ATPase